MSAQGVDTFISEPQRPRQWGPWRLEAATYQLVNVDSDAGEYRVDLLSCTDSAEVLDWIAQIAGKGWGSKPETIAGLVLAIDDLIHMQATICGSGVGKEIAKDEVVKRVDGFAASPNFEQVLFRAAEEDEG
ncbi:hypothetical protein [Rhodococcus sp. SGAir0479]|uniref:hypothetical protein n=1 Tax=Rhodococcus sp. SGAir0479 TaxID=2567884 RepID=UPI0010CCCF2E|nr:hypothetical protein [Rhodococcus sp. SGAir0479]QCQ93047.1 hypothetical protein E7742_18695 [Rhodococcus sp. SGAir0479]